MGTSVPSKSSSNAPLAATRAGGGIVGSMHLYKHLIASGRCVLT
jgi:hypothetical protein